MSKFLQLERGPTGPIRSAGFVLSALLLSTGCGAAKKPFPQGTQVDEIVIVKSAHTMTLRSNGKILQTYKVALGRSSGAKRRAGDHKTPVGIYVIDAKKSKSRFDMALHISYPNFEDRARAARLGEDPGGDIEIHGVERGFAWLGSAQHWMDWTDGCIAVTDSQMEEIWPVVQLETVVEIRQ